MENEGLLAARSCTSLLVLLHSCQQAAAALHQGIDEISCHKDKQQGLSQVIQQGMHLGKASGMEAFVIHAVDDGYHSQGDECEAGDDAHLPQHDCQYQSAYAGADAKDDAGKEIVGNLGQH